MGLSCSGCMRLRIALALAAAVMASSTTLLKEPARALAQSPPPSDQVILDALSTKRVRGVINPGQTARDRALIEALVDRVNRGVVVDDRKVVADLVSRRPSIDIAIPFDYNSAEIGPTAVPALLALGRALSRPELKNAVILLAGHTDAKGGPSFNLKLSNDRANAVRRYVTTEFALAPGRVVALGFGFEQLKNAAAPLAAENRRVEVVNLSGE